MKHKEAKADLEVPVRRRKFKKHEKEPDEITRLEKEIRELKSINRSLLKQIKKLSKGIHRQEYEDAVGMVENGSEKEEQKEPGKRCPECSHPGLRTVVIAGRRFENCSICEYKSKRIK